MRRTAATQVSENVFHVLATEPDALVVEAPAVRAALVWLDEVDLDAEFVTVPQFLRGPHRSAMRLAMEEAVRENDHRRERGWKLFLLLPSLLLFRPRRSRNDHKGKLSESKIFQMGAGRVLKTHPRHRARNDDTTMRPPGRSLVHLEELSSGR